MKQAKLSMSHGTHFHNPHGHASSFKLPQVLLYKKEMKENMFVGLTYANCIGETLGLEEC